MDVSEESYLLALVSALNLTHLVGANSTTSDLAVILEEVPAKEKSFFFLKNIPFLQNFEFPPDMLFTSASIVSLLFYAAQMVRSCWRGSAENIYFF